MKILLLLLISAFSCFGQQTQLTPTDLNIEGLQGRVKRIDDETATLKIKNGVPVETNRYPNRTLIFDKKGRLTYEWTQIEKLPTFAQNYSYDKNGNRHRSTIRKDMFDSDKKVGSEQASFEAIHYDATKQTLYLDSYRGDKAQIEYLRQKYQFVFDSTGRIIQKLTFDTKNQEVFRNAYIYGDKMLPTELRLSMAGNPVGQIFRYSYEIDSHGNWIKQIAEMTILRKSNEPQTIVTYRQISYFK